MIALGAVLLLGAIGGTVVLTANGNKKETVADVEVGECFNGDANDVSTVDCTEPHEFELFHVAAAPAPDGPFPGDDTALTDGGAACTLALTTYYGAPIETAVANGLDIKPIAPTEAQWDDGSTDTYCLAFNPDGEALDQSIEGAGTG
jgi:hypothetical protein